jgi:hypothetical protein
MDLRGINGNVIRKWSSTTTTVGRGEDARCRCGRKLVREEKFESFWRELMDGFVNDNEGEGGEMHGGERISRFQCDASGGEIPTILARADGQVHQRRRWGDAR